MAGGCGGCVAGGGEGCGCPPALLSALTLCVGERARGRGECACVWQAGCKVAEWLGSSPRVSWPLNIWACIVCTWLGPAHDSPRNSRWRPTIRCKQLACVLNGEMARREEMPTCRMTCCTGSQAVILVIHVTTKQPSINLRLHLCGLGPGPLCMGPRGQGVQAAAAGTMRAAHTLNMSTAWRSPTPPRAPSTGARHVCGIKSRRVQDP